MPFLSGSMTEWLETAASMVAQVMGHKLNATAEKIQAWILKHNEVAFNAKAAPGALAE